MVRLSALIAVLSALPAAAQADPQGGLIIMGWSKSGHVALRTYSESFGIDHTCAFEAVIVNLINDEVVWRHSQNWNEGGDGDGRCPGAKAAWKQSRAEVEAALSRFEITGPESRALKAFPTAGLTVTVKRNKDGYEVLATSDALGTKVISKGAAVDYDEEGDGVPRVQGWLSGPDKNRIAVVLKPPCFPQQPCPIEAVVGCHLRAGFKK
jgi:hypothetical protein